VDGWTADANDFYATIVTASTTDNTREAETIATDGGVADPNDEISDAEALTFQTVTSGQGAYLLGFIDPTSDVDTFSFTATAGETIDLACGALRSGSGLTGATFTVLAADGTTVVQTETETATADIAWGDYTGASKAGIAVSADATYYLQVSATGQKADVTSTFYRCGIYRVAAAK